MGRLKFVSTPLYASMQDQGRKHLAYYAIPRSGAMDLNAFEWGHDIVGNGMERASIEFNFNAGKILFESEAVICLTGANMRFMVNDSEVALNEKINIQAGDILSGNWTTDKARAYLAIQGVIKGEKQYGSLSSYPNAYIGYNNGQRFKKGDIIEWQEVPEQLSEIKSVIPEYQETAKIKIKPGPEFSWFDHSITNQMVHKEFSLTSESNRMGARIKEKLLSSMAIPSLEKSVPVLPGFIQLTGSGQLLVVLKDGHTTGGYPRIAYIPSDELSVFGQLMPDQAFHFEWQ